MKPDSALSQRSAPPQATGEMNATAEAHTVRPTYETLALGLSIAAAQLIEAASKARGGDCDASRAHVTHAIALLRGIPSIGPRGSHFFPSTETPIVRGGLTDWKLRRVNAHVGANLSRKIPVTELAQLVGLGSAHFCRAFKCVTGVSPREYIIRRRIELAQAMMLTTSDPLHSIAISCGMCDQQHFTRSFHRIVGQSPARWRGSRRALMTLG